ncbi:hypothetical protein [Streptomyces sp900116325]|uniref:hypothetical protein n=1 Tax=Streptomyces sp. 900116325 TaxID=3154295 RepID=UPI003317BA00
MTSRSAPPADLDALRTGDLVNRRKVLIEYQGCRVPPGRARCAVSDHPQIEDAAVIGVLDAEGEETAEAFVHRQPDRGSGTRP